MKSSHVPLGGGKIECERGHSFTFFRKDCVIFIGSSVVNVCVTSCRVGWILLGRLHFSCKNFGFSSLPSFSDRVGNVMPFLHQLLPEDANSLIAQLL